MLKTTGLRLTIDDIDQALKPYGTCSPFRDPDTPIPLFSQSGHRRVRPEWLDAHNIAIEPGPDSQIEPPPGIAQPSFDAAQPRAESSLDAMSPADLSNTQPRATESEPGRGPGSEMSSSAESIFMELVDDVLPGVLSSLHIATNTRTN